MLRERARRARLAVDDAEDVTSWSSATCTRRSQGTEGQVPGRDSLAAPGPRARGAVIGTVCTGSVLLAEAGLLDGRSCACHWAYGGLFRSPIRGSTSTRELPRSHARGRRHHHRGRRHRLARPRPVPDRALLQPRPRGPHGQGVPARSPRGRPAAVRRDDPRRSGDDAAVGRALGVDGRARGRRQPGVGMARARAWPGHWPAGSRGHRQRPIDYVHAARRAGSGAPRGGAVRGRSGGLPGRLRGPDVLPPVVPARHGHVTRGVPAEVRGDHPRPTAGSGRVGRRGGADRQRLAGRGDGGGGRTPRRGPGQASRDRRRPVARDRA